MSPTKDRRLLSLAMMMSWLAAGIAGTVLIVLTVATLRGEFAPQWVPLLIGATVLFAASLGTAIVMGRRRRASGRRTT